MSQQAVHPVESSASTVRPAGGVRANLDEKKVRAAILQMFEESSPGYLTIGEIEKLGRFSREQVIDSLRNFYQSELLEMIPGNGQYNHRYRLKLKEVKVEAVVAKPAPKPEPVQATKPIEVKPAEPRVTLKSDEELPDELFVQPKPQPNEVASISNVEDKILVKLSRRPGGFNIGFSHDQALKLASALIKNTSSRWGYQAASKDAKNILASTHANEVEAVGTMEDIVIVRLARRPGGYSIVLDLAQAMKLSTDLVRAASRKLPQKKKSPN